MPFLKFNMRHWGPFVKSLSIRQCHGGWEMEQLCIRRTNGETKSKLSLDLPYTDYLGDCIQVFTLIRHKGQTCSQFNQITTLLRDWSLITGREGGYKIGKSQVRNFLRPLPPSRQSKTCLPPPLLKSGNVLLPPPPPPPSVWLKLQATVYKTTPTVFVPPPLPHG